ncbi:hypothetical protein RR42_m1610 [Cupriavidus basilensis]|uniref:Uncharacterized protein n=1 Tax=Cupriavidus basilensis TaxID=68895 RepID=A0A0C4Y7R0_9BURK|nr:hypothetical protein RR42_m1610 [Cupriavidus basilensis]
MSEPMCEPVPQLRSAGVPAMACFLLTSPSDSQPTGFPTWISNTFPASTQHACGNR